LLIETTSRLTTMPPRTFPMETTFEMETSATPPTTKMPSSKLRTTPFLIATS
jgi:hypothetical protein